MSRLVPRTLLAVAATAAVAMIGPTGCAENRSSFFVVGSLAEPDDCAYQFDPGQPRVERGVYDLAFGTGYTGVLLLGNQYIPLGNNNQIRSETSRIQLLGAEVDLRSIDGARLAHFTTATSGTVDPAPSAAPGYGGASVLMIPADLAVGQGEYLATIRVYGRTLGGQNVETGEFIFPIQVCRGCLVTFSSESLSAGQCLGGGEVRRCRPGQDTWTDCTFCPDPSDPACQP